MEVMLLEKDCLSSSEPRWRLGEAGIDCMCIAVQNGFAVTQFKYWQVTGVADIPIMAIT